MLLAYGARNCWSFKNWFEINLRVNKKAPVDIAFSQKKVVPAICFEGPNASGKTCALRVLSFFYDFCLNSFSYAPKSNILFNSFFSNDEKSDFFISFCLGYDFENEYTYEVELNKTKIFSEIIYKKSGKRTKTVLLKRKNNKIIENALYKHQDGIIFKDTASFISTLLQYEVKEIEPFGEFFRNFKSNVSYISAMDVPMTDFTAQYYYEHPDILKKVVQQLRTFDTGIKDIEIIPVQDNQGRDIYMSVFVHDTDTEQNKLHFLAQSNGTKLLYNILKDFFLILENGGVLVFDELDTHLHSEIVPYLLKFFTDISKNKKNAQIIFTAHSTALLDTMKKYRVYLFKKIKSESICYRIDELHNNNLHRNDRSLEQLYKSGALGGIPDVAQE